MRKKRVFLIAVLLIIAGSFLTVFICNKIVVNTAKDKLFIDVNTIPYNRVGLLLGTSKTMKNGYANPYYTNRIIAATQLFRANKIKYIIVSGDNSSNSYDEPTAMRTDLISAGIDSTKIYLDYAGFRTFDSVKRLKTIFGQDTVTIISQQFHNERALYIASREGITAIAFNAADISANPGIKMLLREKLARVKVFIDYWLGTKPKYLGEKVIIPA